MKDGLYAEINTSKGVIVSELFFNKVPGTVGNFVGLAEGKIENDFKSKDDPFYDNLKFHRVISEFMIQSGCPKGTGSGGPGYKFDDEFHKDLIHDKPGILSMANSGPGSNGSQFFITHKATPWLDGKHTVFGQVIKGQEIVDLIVQNDFIKKIKILRFGDLALDFKSVESFEEHRRLKILRLEELRKKQIKQINLITKGFEKTKTNLYYKIYESGSKLKPSQGQTVSVHYKGMLIDETVFDSSLDRNKPIEFKLGSNQVIEGWEIGISLLSKGDKAKFVIPPELAYGSSGAGGVIPPDATLIFEVELVDFH